MLLTLLVPADCSHQSHLRARLRNVLVACDPLIYPGRCEDYMGRVGAAYHTCLRPGWYAPALSSQPIHRSQNLDRSFSTEPDISYFIHLGCEASFCSESCEPFGSSPQRARGHYKRSACACAHNVNRRGGLHYICDERYSTVRKSATTV